MGPLLQTPNESSVTVENVMVWLNNGLAVIIVIAIGLAIWKSSTVLFNHVIVPLKDAFLKHLICINEYMDKTAKALDSTAEALQNINNEVKSIRIDMDDVKEDVEEVKTEILEVRKKPTKESL